jgi:hypothetical protein
MDLENETIEADKRYNLENKLDTHVLGGFFFILERKLITLYLILL